MTKSRIVGIVSLIAACGSSASATTLTLEDANSTASFSLTAGLQQISWVVDGIDHLASQRFALKIGNQPTQFLDDTDITDFRLIDTDRDPGNDKLGALITFEVEELEVRTLYSLIGGAAESGSSLMKETIFIENNSDDDIELSFFQLVDFDLAGTPFDTSVSLVNEQTAVQIDTSNGVTQASMIYTDDGSASPELLDVIAQVGLAEDVIEAVMNGSLVFTPTFDGSGDLAFAVEWQIVLAPGESFVIADARTIQVLEPIPAPAGALAMFAGGLLAARRRR